jgi:hypothetical protein
MINIILKMYMMINMQISEVNDPHGDWRLAIGDWRAAAILWLRNGSRALLGVAWAA